MMTSEQRLEILKKLAEVGGGVEMISNEVDWYEVSPDNNNFRPYDHIDGVWRADEYGRTCNNRDNRRLDTRLLQLYKEYA